MAVSRPDPKPLLKEKGQKQNILYSFPAEDLRKGDWDMGVLMSGWVIFQISRLAWIRLIFEISGRGSSDESYAPTPSLLLLMYTKKNF